MKEGVSDSFLLMVLLENASSYKGVIMFESFSVDLVPNEKIIFIGKISWYEYIPLSVLFIVGLFAVPSGGVWALGFSGFILLFILRLYIIRLTEKLVITSEKLIYKKGWLFWDIQQIDYRQIESVNINQSLLGRLFNFGTLTVSGTGGMLINIIELDSPKRINQLILTQLQGYSVHVPRSVRIV